MGTELVPFKSWAEFTTARKNMVTKSKGLPERVTVVLLIVSVVAGGAVMAVSTISTNLGNIAALIVGAVVLYERLIANRAEMRCKIVNAPNIGPEFPCPHCNENFNLGLAWVCGWCKEIHNDWLPNKMQTPVIGCPRDECTETRCHQLSTGRGDQAALQCPSCRRHVVLDPVLYEQEQCHMSPYNGVARFVGDTSEPNKPMPIRSVFPTAPGSPGSTKNTDPDWFENI